MSLTTAAEVEPLEERCAWRSAEVADSYIWELTDADRAELDAALLHAEAHTERTLDITADLAAELYAPFAYDLRGEEGAGRRPWYLMPVFTRQAERLFVRYIRPYILSARRHADAPAPSAAATEAMDRVDAMCADPEHHLSMQLEPGDMQFVNNYHVLHARDAYTDDRPSGRVRHLKRLWLETAVLTSDDKPEAFRLGATTETWWEAAQRSDADG